MGRDTSSRRPRTTAKVQPDGHRKKRFPDGISSSILAVRNYWPSLTGKGGECLSVEKFCDAGFGEVYAKVVGSYSGIRKKPMKPTSVKSMVYALCKGEQDIEFFQLRAFAEYVGLPTGLFLLFTQMVSHERHCLDRPDKDDDCGRKQSLEFIRRVRRMIEAAERHIESSTPGKPLFNHLSRDELQQEKYMAKALTLKVWSDAFKDQS